MVQMHPSLIKELKSRNSKRKFSPELILQRMNLTDSLVCSLSGFLASNPCMSTLDISHNHINEDGYRCVLRAVKHQWSWACKTGLDDRQSCIFLGRVTLLPSFNRNVNSELINTISEYTDLLEYLNVQNYFRQAFKSAGGKDFEIVTQDIFQTVYKSLSKGSFFSGKLSTKKMNALITDALPPPKCAHIQQF